MAQGDDKDSKTEEPTFKKISDAQEKGNVPSSREATTFASFIALLVAGFFLFGSNILHLQHALSHFIGNPNAWRLENAADAILLLKLIGYETAKLLVPVVLLLMIAGIGSSALQNAPRLVLTRIQPKWSHLSLTKGLGRIFGMTGLVEFGKAIFKVTAVGIVGYLVFQITEAEIYASMFMEPIILPGLIRTVLLRIFIWITLLTLALVVLDILWTRFKWRKDLRMSKQEIKDEHKQAEGDPLVKQRIRMVARERARRRMIAEVPRATLVITNPTHYAVALRYVRDEGGAPLVIAKGQNLIALKIREIAESYGIPIIEDKPLARSLYDTVEVNKMIPSEFYKAVAEIIFYLHQRKIRN